MSSNATVSQLDRIESMLADIHWGLFGQWAQLPPLLPAVSGDALIRPSVAEPGPSAPDLAEADSMLRIPSTPSPSKKRRQRANQTQKRLWRASTGESDVDKSDGEKVVCQELKRMKQEFPNCHPEKSQGDRDFTAGVKEDSNCVFCNTCGETLEECICRDIFCRSCLRLAADCSCQQCFLKRRICHDCKAIEDVASLFHDRPSMDATTLPTSFKCTECAGERYDEGEYYYVESAKVCSKCNRLGYYNMMECDRTGAGCLSEGLFHECCLALCGTSRLCDSCVQKPTHILETRLAGMISLVEHMQDIGSADQPCIRKIIGFSRETYNWMQQARSEKEIKDRAALIDALMDDAIKSMNV